jgi:hypothetical protein
VKLVLDSGALIALERNDREVWRRIKRSLVLGDALVTHGGVVGQVWRGGGRQALLALALESVDVRPLDEELGRAAGALLAAAKRRDVIDAALVLLARDDDRILTSDPGDIEPLVELTGRHVDLVVV